MYLKKQLSKELSAFYSKCFPRYKQPTTRHRYESVVGIGGNVGDVKRRFEHLLVFLERERRVEVVKTSLILKNPPFGFVQQDDFLNAIMVMKTSMQPKQFLAYLLRVEKRFGRKRSFANAPRTLDMDIIFFDNRVIQSKQLTVPHPHWFQRESVVIPLAGMQR